MVSRVAVCRTDGLAEWTEPTLNEAFRYAHTHRRRRRDSTVELSRVGVGGVYWALDDRTTMYITGPTVLRC